MPLTLQSADNFEEAGPVAPDSYLIHRQTSRTIPLAAVPMRYCGAPFVFLDCDSDAPNERRRGKRVLMLTSSELSPIAIVQFLAAVLVASVWHECGHLFVARRRDVPVRLIAVGFGRRLWRRQAGELAFEVRAIPFGMAVGVLPRRAPDGTERRSAGSEFAVAAGGPAASFLLTLLLIPLVVVTRDLPGLSQWLLGTGALSVLLTVLNLIPFPGLDGGHMLMLILAGRGWQLSPKHEVAIHRTGMQVMLIASSMAMVVSIANGRAGIVN